MYTASQVYSGVKSGAHLPSPMHPTVAQLHQQWGEPTCNTREKLNTFAYDRHFSNVKLAQAQGGVVPMQYMGQPTFVNPTMFAAAVQGRDTKMGDIPWGDTYRAEEVHAGYVPMKQLGLTGPPPLADYMATISDRACGENRGEIVFDRPPASTVFQPNIILPPVSESSLIRKENACRLEGIRRRMIESQLAAAASGAW
jgi:hypothetical protein